MCSSAGYSSSWGRRTVWRQAVISPINSSGWVRLSAQPLPTLPPALLPFVNTPKYGYASAVSMVLFVLVLFVTIIQFKGSSSND